jgi:hypothetical protein
MSLNSYTFFMSNFPSPYSTRFSPPRSRFRTLPPIFTSPYRSGAFRTLSGHGPGKGNAGIMRIGCMNGRNARNASAGWGLPGVTMTQGVGTWSVLAALSSSH